MKKFCNGASVLDFGLPKTAFTFGMNSCVNEAGMMSSLKRPNGGRKKLGWLQGRRSRRCLHSSMPTKGARLRTIISNRRNACRYNANVLLGQGVDSFRESEIELGQAPFAVGRKDQAHLVIADVDIRMVLFVFRYLGDRIHKIDRIGKIIEFKGALDVFLFQLPFGDLF